MDCNLFNLSPFNNYLFEDLKDNNFKLIENIWEDNFFFINKLYKNPTDNIWEILSISWFNSNKHLNEIKNKFEESIDYLENNTMFEKSKIDIFNDADLDFKCDKVSKLFNIKIIIYNVNLQKNNLLSKIFGNLKNENSIKIMIHKNNFFNLLENKRLNKNKNINSFSTFNDSKELNEFFDVNQNLYEFKSFYLYLNGKNKENYFDLPYNMNLMNLEGYIQILEKLYPKKNLNSFSQGIKNIEKNEFYLKRSFGSLKFFDKTKSFGFLVNEVDNSDLFVHYDDLNKMDIKFDIFKIFKKSFYLRFSFLIFEYIGKHSKSKKAINIKLEEIKLIYNKITN